MIDEDTLDPQRENVREQILVYIECPFPIYYIKLVRIPFLRNGKENCLNAVVGTCAWARSLSTRRRKRSEID